MSPTVTYLVERINEGLNIALKSNVGVFLGRAVLRLQSHLPVVHPAVKVAVVAGTIIGSLAYVISSRREIEKVKKEYFEFSQTNESKDSEIKRLKNDLEKTPLEINKKQVEELKNQILDLEAIVMNNHDSSIKNQNIIDEQQKQIKQFILANELLANENSSLNSQVDIAKKAILELGKKMQVKDNEINTLKSQLETAKEKEITS